MVKFKIELDRRECISCGSCAALCPNFFEIESDGKTKLIGATEKVEENNEIIRESVEVDDPGCAKDVVGACPSNSIHVTEMGE